METRIINGRKYFTHFKGDDEQADVIAVKMMERNDIYGLLPFHYVCQEGEQYFRYEADVGETLEKWLERVQHRRNVLKLLESLVFVRGEADAYLLDENNICTELRFVMVKDNQCAAAYIPVEDGIQGDFIKLAQQIIFNVRYAMDEDFSYLFDLQNAFGRRDIQNMTDLKKWIRIAHGERNGAAGQEDLDNSVPVSADSRRKTENQQADKSDRQGMNGEMYRELGISNADEGKGVKKTAKKHGFFMKSKKGKMEEENTEPELRGNSLKQEEQLPKEEIINKLSDEDSTVIVAVNPLPALVQAGSGMEYCIADESYVIGSGMQADIIVQDNPTVSRKHARIFYTDGSYYIEDIGSTNGTCVNGEMLRRMEPYKLSDQAKIQFSDEDFVFKIRR